jgi:uncharacterized membrane protein YhhN
MTSKIEDKILRREKDLATSNTLIENLFPILYFSFMTLLVIIDIKGYYHLRYVMKPLTMITLILYYLKKTDHHSSFLKHSISTALIFSLLGDIALMFCDHYPAKISELFFVAGLSSFAIGHIFFILAYHSNIQNSKETARF